ncbi:hypothetical protein BH09PAT2_BH09PAT2_05770 [soil metagenome]
MITTIISDFSNVLLFPKNDTYSGSLNDLNKQLIKEKGEHYDFFYHFAFNHELWNVYKNINGKYPIYIFTTDTIQERTEVRTILDSVVADIFVANVHNLKKNETDAYLFIAHRLQKLPQTFLYIDDLAANVEAAKKAGMHAIQYINNDQIINYLKELQID